MTSFLALVMTLILCVPVMAAGENYTMAIEVNGGSSATVARGSAVTVTLTLAQDGADDFDLYCMQDYVCFDPAYFTYVEDSLQVYTVGAVQAPVFSASAIAFPAGESQLNRIYVNRVSSQAQSVPSGVTALSFQLTAIQNGTTTLSHDKTEVFQTPGQLYPCALSSATVTISDNGGGSTGGGSTGGGGGSSGGDTDIQDPDTPLTDLPFVDVPSDAWFEDAVYGAYEKGLMNGTDATHFSPQTSLSRAMLAQVLYSLSSKPSINVDQLSALFDDVLRNSWYTDAVYWAREEGVLTGYDAQTFGPEDPITREQLALALYQYSAVKGYDTGVHSDLSAFADRDRASSWAEHALCWAVEHRIMSGKGDGILDPTGTATRAEVAQMLMSYLENVANAG